MSILKDAKVGDQVEDSLGNKGTINYINQTLGLYNVIFEADNRKCYTVDGNGYSTELQPTDSRLMTHIPAKKPTTFQALPVAAENYPTLKDIDVNGNIQILTPRGWEVCNFLKGEYQKEEWAHTPLYMNVPKKLAWHVQRAIEGYPLTKPVLQELLTYLK